MGRVLPVDAIQYYIDHAYDFVIEQILGKMYPSQIRPTWQQKQYLDAVSKYNRIGIRSGHGPGKDTSFAWTIIWYLYTRPAPTKIPCTAPTYHQLHDVLWPEISRWLSTSYVKSEFDWQITELKIKSDPKGRFAVARSSKKSDFLQGFHAPHLLWIIDEAYGIADPLIPEVIEGAITGESDNKIVFGGNPTTISGYWHDAFHADKRRWEKNGKLFTWNAELSPIVSKTHIEDLARKWGKHSDIYRVRVLGLPPLGNPDAFLRLTDIEAAIQREVEPAGRVEMGVDCARFGDDLTVIAPKQGYHFFELEIMPKSDEVQIHDRVIDTVRKYRHRLKYYDVIDIKIDTTGGYGAGAYDLLRRNTRDKINVIPISFAGGGNDEYANATSIMWGELRDVLGQIQLPDDTNLVGELSTRRFKLIASQGRTKVLIEPKSDYKNAKTGFGQSPDRSDAIILANTSLAIAKTVVPLFDTSDCMYEIDVKFGQLSENTTPIVCLHAEENLKISAMIALWNSEEGKLWLLLEHIFEQATAEAVLSALTRRMRRYSHDTVNNLNEFDWIGNHVFFQNKNRGGDMRAAYHALNMPIREIGQYDENGAILRLQRLIFRKRFAMDHRMTHAALQLQEWYIGDRNKPVTGYGLCRCLLTIVAAIEQSGRMQPAQPKFRHYTNAHTKYHDRIKNLAAQDKLHLADVITQNDTAEKDGWMRM